LHFYFFQSLQQFIVTPRFQLNLVNHFGKYSVNVPFDIFERFKNILLERAKFLEQFGFGLFDGRFDFGGIDVHGSEVGEVFFGLSDDHFEGFDFVIFM
jgi:hypothetical protein